MKTNELFIESAMQSVEGLQIDLEKTRRKIIDNAKRYTNKENELYESIEEMEAKVGKLTQVINELK